MVVVGYGQIIPQSIIDIAPLGIINVHASLLPELRGAAPIQWSIARGYKRTGVTTMRIDAGLDTGDILLQWETPIGPDETAPELSARLAEAGADLLVETLGGLVRGHHSAAAAGQFTRHLRAHPEEGRRAHRLEQSSPTDSRFDSWLSTLARSAYLVPRPIASPLALAPGSRQHWNLPPGALDTRRSGVFAVGGDGAALELLEVQLEGRKRMPAEVFANGHRSDRHRHDRLGA